ncbi:MAG: hypothetical protein AAB618_03855 [Patescibacteria group bacterium]
MNTYTKAGSATTVAKVLFESGAVQIDTKVGFRLKAHDRFPDAPLSPIYLSIRPKGIKDGTLEPHHFTCLGNALAQYTKEQKVFADWICGIPAAGEPIAEALMRAGSGPLQLSRETKLLKGLVSGRRRIIGVIPGNNGVIPHKEQTVLLVDDLVTNADSKLEAAAAFWGIDCCVDTLLVLIDRSSNARQKLARSGIKLHALLTFTQLLDYGRAEGAISDLDYEVITAYPKKLAASTRRG